MEKIALIFGAGERSALPQLPSREQLLVIAADGGYAYCRESFGEPDLAVGDFDSLGYVPKGVATEIYPPEKDDTDLGIAIKAGISRGCHTFYILGATGGRLDHTLAALQSMAALAEDKKTVFLFGRDFTATVIGGGSLRFPQGYGGTVSVFAFGGECRGVELRGLRYPLKDATLSPRMPLGVSNEFTSERASLSCQSGKLLILWQGNLDKTLPSCYDK